MKLKKLSDRIWYYPYEEERDRPNLGYIKGDNFSIAVDAGNCPIRLIYSQSPHTDDSTLVYAIDEKVLFIGDSNGGEFPSGLKRRDLCEGLVETISSIGAEICLEGHWTPDTPDGIIKDIMS